MTAKFKKAIKATPEIANAYCVGLRAFSAADKAHIKCTCTQKLDGSVNLDRALQARYLNDPRWDYAIGWCTSGRNVRVLWVEIHPASTGNVKEVITKLTWLKQWMDASAPKIKALGEMQFHWIATGAVAISKNSPQARRLAQSKIKFPARILHLDQC